MLNTVIVTVRSERAGIGYDMEIPADVPIGELCRNLLAALKDMAPEAFGDVESISLRTKRDGRPLDEDETPESAEVWDGSILLIEY